MTTTDSTHDLAQLRSLGTRRRRLRQELNRINADIAVELRTAHNAGAAQIDLIHASGMAREAVRRITRGLPWSPRPESDPAEPGN